MQRPSNGRTGFARLLAAMSIAGACALVAVGCGGSSSDTKSSDGAATAPKSLKTVKYQLSWTPDEGVIGEVVAAKKGFFAEEGLKLEIVPGGPNNDGVAPVAAGKADIGLASSSPSIMLAVSQGIPIQTFASTLQKHPYAYFSLPDTPLSSAADFKGKTVGVPATGKDLVKALLLVNHMSVDDLKTIKPVSFEVTPLLQHRVDIWGGWLTDIKQLALLPAGYHSLSLWDAGVKLYSGLYFANPRFLKDNASEAEAFVRAAAKGWMYTRDHPAEAAQIFVDAYPDAEGKATAKSTEESLKVLLSYMFTESADQNGWGAMDPAIWEQQISTWKQTGQFKAKPPTVDQVMTPAILDATADARAVK